MKTIKTIAYKQDNTVFGTHNANTEEAIKILADDKTYKMFHKDDIILSNWWYFHGYLQTKIGFDRGSIINYEDLDIIEKKEKPFLSNVETTNISIKNGIYEVKVHGINQKCIGYFWNVDFGLRGLVCLESDYDGRQYAMDKYIEKSTLL